MISEEFWADNFNVHIEDDSEFEYIKKEIVDSKKGISGYTTDVSRTKEDGLMIHTKIVYQDLDVEPSIKPMMRKKRLENWSTIQIISRTSKKKGFKRIK